MKTRILLSIFLVSQLAISQTYSWTQQTSGVAQTLNDVYFINDQKGWVVGVSGIVLNTSNGGMQWSAQSSGTTQYLETVFFISESLGWIGGGASNALLLKTTNGGQSWTPIATSINKSILDIEFVDNNIGWLITSDSIYYSSNGGLTWTAEGYTGLNATAVNASLAVVSASSAFVGGRKFQTGVQDSSPEVFDRRVIGSSYMWGPTTAEQFDGNDRIESIAFASETLGFAGGINGKLYKMEAVLPVVSGPWVVSMDLGGGNNQTINSIVFPTEERGLFSTPSQMGMNTYSLIYHTFNEGDTWLGPDSIPNFLVQSMCAPNDMMAWAVGVGGKIYRGIDPAFDQKELSSAFELQVYPNPIGNIFTIQASQPLAYMEIVITNHLGQMVFIGSMNHSNRLEVDSQFWPAGVYYVRIENNSLSIVNKLIKL